MLTRGFRLLLGLTFVLACAGVAYPCTCFNPSLEVKLRKSGAVFVGRVVEIQKMRAGPYEYSIRFAVERAWKGVADSEIELPANYDEPGMCNDMHFQLGQKYLVYATIDVDGCLSIERDCGWTRRAEHARGDIKRLVLEFTPKPPVDRSRDRIVAIIFGIASLAVASLLFVRRQ